MLTDRHEAAQHYATPNRAQVRTEHIQTWVQELATAADVRVSFQPPRRQADIALFTLYGNRSDVLILPPKFSEFFTDEDIEIIRSEAYGINYRLRLVITHKLDAHQLNTPERRSKLRFHQNICSL